MIKRVVEQRKEAMAQNECPSASFLLLLLLLLLLLPLPQ